MPDALTTITHLINSPPGQLAAGDVWQAIAVQFGLGLGLFYGVTKFFDVVGDRLNEDTKLEIAVWLLGVKVGQKVEPWPDTFAKVFDRVFGTKHLTWRCFWRSTSVSLAMAALCVLITTWTYYRTITFDGPFILVLLGVLIISNVLPDYISLLETRKLLSLMSRSKRGAVWLIVLIIDGFVTVTIASWGTILALILMMSLIGRLPFSGLMLLAVVLFWPLWLVLVPGIMTALIWGGGLNTSSIGFVTLLPAFFTSIWLWLYAGSGFILKAARRFDIGFDWFNRKFDIEKKPLQSIGLVAGVVVALVYWAAVIVSRVVG